MVTIRVNGQTPQVDAEPGTPLLWVLRDNLGLTGTKYGRVQRHLQDYGQAHPLVTTEQP